MFCVCVLKASSSGEILGFSMEDHAGYGEQGSDILCAAISSAAYMTANTLTDVLNVSPEILEVDDGYMYIRVFPEDASLCRNLFAGFKLHMVGLEEQYPENIQVNYLEV